MDDWFGRGEALRSRCHRWTAPSGRTTCSIPPRRPSRSRSLIVWRRRRRASSCPSGRSLFSVPRPDGAPLATFDTEISALTGLPDGGAAVGLIDGRIAFIGGEKDGKTIASGADIQCITALASGRDGALLIANGSASNGPLAYKRDLMEKNASGSVWRLDTESGGRRRLADKLAYPYGLLEEADALVVSESWRSALTRISLTGRRNEPVLENLPAYPSRLSRSADNAIWLALFAPRSQLVEFVLRETGYRRRMLDEIDPDYWIAPAVRAGQAPEEPTQQGGVRQQGVLKPWAPSAILWTGRAARP